MLGFLIVDTILVRFFRYRTRDSIGASFADRDLTPMTPDGSTQHTDPTKISRPRIPKSLRNICLLRSIQTLRNPIHLPGYYLQRGANWATTETASERAADTDIILTQVILNKPGSRRTIDGIAKMNYLHGLYRKSGKISDDGTLYNAESLFALEPLRWVDRFEWEMYHPD